MDRLSSHRATKDVVEKHGFKEIDIITGYDFIEASNLRVNGYRKSLEKHGIEYDEKRVHYGNFWMNSGEELAERYHSGELPLPQAIVCANDYMAYGLIDKFD
jgi:DNA-binding LacI/PurR family transcriptional regulator